MATKAPAAPAPSTSTALAVPEVISNKDLMALLQQAGMVSPEYSNFRRMRMDGGILNTLDSQGGVENMFPPLMENGEPKPSLTVRIVKPPVYYNAFWLGPEFDERGKPTNGIDPGRIGRADLNKLFAKRYDDESEQAKDKNPANEVYDQIAALTNRRGDFKADIQLQIMPKDGVFKGDEPVYTLSLPASAALDFRGSRKNPEGGVAQEQNFMYQLGALAVKIGLENGATRDDLEQWVLNAHEAFRIGGVVADIYLLRASNSDGSQKWTIPAFKPVHIEFAEHVETLPATTDTASDEPIASDDPGF